MDTRDIGIKYKQKQLEESGKRYGLVVGINEYVDVDIRNLKYAVNDAGLMQDLMEDQACGVFDEVICLNENDASRLSILKALSYFKRICCEEDTFWFFFAGHGSPFEDEFYLLPVDAEMDELDSTGISPNELNSRMKKIVCNTKISILDCCHAGMLCEQLNTRSASTMNAKDILSQYSGAGHVKLLSSNSAEKAVELDDVSHGAFTYYFVKGLRGEADYDEKGLVTLDDAWRYLDKKVRDAARRQNVRQNPVIEGNFSHGLPMSLNVNAINWDHDEETKVEKTSIDEVYLIKLYNSVTNRLGINTDQNQKLTKKINLLLQNKESVLEELEYFINQKWAVNGVDESGKSVFEIAIANNRIDFLSSFIKFGFDMDGMNQSGVPYIYQAVQEGKKQVVDLMIANYADYRVKLDHIDLLEFSIKHRQFDITVRLVSIGMNVNELRQDGYSLLHKAIFDEDMELIRKLIDLGSDPESTCRLGYTGYDVASYFDNHELLTLLKDKIDDDVSKYNFQGLENLLRPIQRYKYQGINYECSDDSVVEADIILSSKKGIEALKAVNCPPILFAVLYSDETTVGLLVEQGFNVDDMAMDVSALEMAYATGKVSVLKMLVKAGANVDRLDQFGNTITSLAIDHQNIEVVEFMIENGATTELLVGHHKETYLIRAVRNGMTDMVKKLLDLGVNIEAVDSAQITPLMRACNVGNVEIVDMLLSAGASCYGKDKSGYDPLDHALISKDSSIVRKLCKNGMGYDKKVSSLINGMKYSFVSDDEKNATIKIIKVLANHQAEVDIDEILAYEKVRESLTNIQKKDLSDILIPPFKSKVNRMNRGKTYLINAVLKGDAERVQLLLRYGADADQPGEYNGFRPIIYAVRSNNQRITKLLIDSGIDINNSHNWDNISPLLVAVNHQFVSLVKLLLESGADPSKGSFGADPIKLADQKGYHEIYRLLKNAVK